MLSIPLIDEVTTLEEEEVWEVNILYHENHYLIQLKKSVLQLITNVLLLGTLRNLIFEIFVGFDAIIFTFIIYFVFSTIFSNLHNNYHIKLIILLLYASRNHYATHSKYDVQFCQNTVDTAV